MTWNQETLWIRKWGGVCQGSVPEHIPLGMFADALNYQLIENGALSPRFGFDLVAQGIPAPDGKPVKSILHADMDGTYRLLVATTHHVYEVTLGDGAWNCLYTIVDTGAGRVTFAPLNGNAGPLVVWGNGSDPLQQWDGTSVTELTDAPRGRPVAFKNYLTVFGIAGEPGKVQFAAYPGRTDLWTRGGVELYVEMQGQVTSAFQFAGNLVVFTRTRTELFAGDPNQVLGMSVLSSTIGCVTHETVADCGGILTWLSQSGVQAWDGGGAFPAANLSNPDDSTHPDVVSSRIQRDLDLIDWTSADAITGLYDSVRQRYLLSAWIRPIAAGEAEPRTWCFDFRFRAWHPWTLEATALAMFMKEETGRLAVIAGTSTGYLREQGWSRFKDEDSPATYTEYDYWAQSGAHDFGEPNTEKTFRAITVGSSGGIYPWVSGARTIQVMFTGEFYRISGGTATGTTPAQGFVLGTSVLGDEITEPESRYFEKRVPIALRAKHLTFKWFKTTTENRIAVSAFGISLIPGGKRHILVGND